MHISNIALCIMYVVLISGRNQTQDITRRSLKTISMITLSVLRFQQWQVSDETC